MKYNAYNFSSWPNFIESGECHKVCPFVSRGSTLSSSLEVASLRFKPGEVELEGDECYYLIVKPKHL